MNLWWYKLWEFIQFGMNSFPCLWVSWRIMVGSIHNINVWAPDMNLRGLDRSHQSHVTLMSCCPSLGWWTRESQSLCSANMPHLWTSMMPLGFLTLANSEFSLSIGLAWLHVCIVYLNQLPIRVTILDRYFSTQLICLVFIKLKLTRCPPDGSLVRLSQDRGFPGPFQPSQDVYCFSGLSLQRLHNATTLPRAQCHPLGF